MTTLLTVARAALEGAAILAFTAGLLVWLAGTIGV